MTLRRVIALGMALLGLGTLVYFYYASFVLRAYVHMLEALHITPVEQSETVAGRLLPFVGWLLLAAATVVCVGPELKNRMRRSRQTM